ncbi:MAG: tRNA pseudouridine(38-40) synthase TruA [Cytophagales bacterium]|nr:MAG: tRNA pseudouridine(38-40) synthase TruA [Rhodothermaeota bacterium MED-G16]
MRYFIDISYFGKNYHGWQTQENAITIQEILDKSLSTILKTEIKSLGSGRTDTGVHAMSQVAHFDFNGNIIENFLYRINSLLPSDISINSINGVKENVSARFDAISREYIYKIHTKKSPFLNDYSYYYKRDIDIELLNKACDIIKKFKDFQTFSKVKTDVNNYNCNVSYAAIEKENNSYFFKVTSNRFLRGMVRALMGTLFEINENKIELEFLEDIIIKKERKLAGPSVPAHGLYLNKVLYEEDIYL